MSPPRNGHLVAGGPLVQAQLPECRLMCSSSECLVVRALLHTVQVYGRSPVCILVWTCKDCFWAKPFPHSLHLKGRSPRIKAPTAWCKQESACLSVPSQIKMAIINGIYPKTNGGRHKVGNKIWKLEEMNPKQAVKSNRIQPNFLRWSLQKAQEL